MAPSNKINRKTKKGKRENDKAFRCSLSKSKVYVQNQYFGERMVTRRKKLLFEKFQIKGVYIRLSKKLSVEALNYLRETEENNEKNEYGEIGAMDENFDHGEVIESHIQNALQQEAGPSKQPHSSNSVKKVSNEPLTAMETMSIGKEQTKEPLKDNTNNIRGLPELLQIYEQPRKVAKRRGSVAGGMLFAVNNVVTEMASDSLDKVPRRTGLIMVQKGDELNQFDPFRRTNNVSFSLKGRPRVRSVNIERRPSLSTLYESEEEGNYMSLALQERFFNKPSTPSTCDEQPVPIETNQIEPIEKDNELAAAHEEQIEAEIIEQHDDAAMTVTNGSDWVGVVQKWVGRLAN